MLTGATMPEVPGKVQWRRVVIFAALAVGIRFLPVHDLVRLGLVVAVFAAVFVRGRPTVAAKPLLRVVAVVGVYLLAFYLPGLLFAETVGIVVFVAVIGVLFVQWMRKHQATYR